MGTLIMRKLPLKTHLLAVVGLVLSSCSLADTVPRDREVSVDDGLYPVHKHEDPPAEKGARIVELVEVPESPDWTPQTVLVVDEPVLRFRETVRHRFKFDKNECTEIELENTDALKAFTRNHIGARLAVVVDGKVVSSHKIRNPVETENITITFCTEGAGNEVYDYLKTVLPPSGQ